MIKLVLNNCWLKYLNVAVLLVVMFLGLFSCNDKVDLIGDGQERAIVYGVLDPSETTHYVKITRSFIGNGKDNSIDIAKISDSSYFKKVKVQIQEILPNNQLGRLFILHDTLIKNKDTKGVFYAPDQKMYVFYTSSAQPLLDDAKYRMSIDIDDGRIKISGETGIVSGISFGNWSSPFYGFRLTKSGEALGQYATQSLNITSVGTSYRMSAKVRFHYKEFSAISDDSTDQSIWFNLGEVSVNPGFSSTQTFSFHGDAFYNRLKQQISPLNPAILSKRVHRGFEIQITGASLELVNYMDVTRPSSSLAQNKPKYTNMTVSQGYEVVGIFASRNTQTIYKNASTIHANEQALDPKSRRELCMGPITNELGFCSDHQADNKLTDPKPWRCQ